MKSSKRYKKLLNNPKPDKSIPINDLIAFVKSSSTAKFNESIDVSFKINIKQKKTDINLRTVVNLPHGTGKKIKVAVICEESKLDEAKKSGADIFDSENLIRDISAGKIKFDKLISTPTMMVKLAKLGKILGPKGLMPNPKLGTVTNDIKSTVKILQSSQVEIKNDKDGNIATSIGKKDFSDVKLSENFNTVLQTIKKEKPTGIKGDFIKSAFLTSTMGISYKLSLKGISK